jgi:hypothetical protein
MRDNADGHEAVGVNGTAIVSTAAGIAFGAHGLLRYGDFLFGALAILRPANRVAKIEGDNLLGGEAHGQGTLGTIGARIDECVEFEFDAQIL